MVLKNAYINTFQMIKIRFFINILVFIIASNLMKATIIYAQKNNKCESQQKNNGNDESGVAICIMIGVIGIICIFNHGCKTQTEWNNLR